MKLFSLFLILWAAFATEIRAQVSAVTIELELDQKQFLSNEDVRVAVRITNRSGQTLQLGKENDWVTFTFAGRNSYVVSQISDVPVVGEFSLASAKTGIKRVNLTPHFNFRQPGKYEITATVKIAQWDKSITSRPIAFDVISGTTLKELDFGVPTTATNVQPEMRKYILQQAVYLSEMKLYFRLTDATSTTTFRVFPIAPMTSFSQPETQIDMQSNLHVLHQIGARAFNYCVINPDGEIIARQVHDYTSSRPTLKANSEGKIFVVGGVQRISSNDLRKPSQMPAKDAQPKK